MTMVVGSASIAVNANGVITVTGSGMAKSIADAMAVSGGSVHSRVAEMLQSVPAELREAVFPGIGGFFEKLAHDCAVGVVNHLTTNAQAVIGTSTVAGRMPASTAAGTPISPPQSNVSIPIQ